MTLLTERDAALRWCPFARVALHAGSGGATANRHPSDGSTDHRHNPPAIEDETRCIGSRCMAWRWHGQAPDRALPEFQRKSVSWPFWKTEDDVDFATAAQAPEPARPSSVPDNWESVPITGDSWEDADGGEWREPAAEADERFQLAADKRQGCCGLAGMPGARQ